MSSIYTSRSVQWPRKREMIHLHWRQSKISEELGKTPTTNWKSRYNSAKGMTSHSKPWNPVSKRACPSNSTCRHANRPRTLTETQIPTVSKSQCTEITHRLGSIHKPKASYFQKVLSESRCRASISDLTDTEAQRSNKQLIHLDCRVHRMNRLLLQTEWRTGAALLTDRLNMVLWIWKT